MLREKLRLGNTQQHPKAEGKTPVHHQETHQQTNTLNHDLVDNTKRNGDEGDVFKDIVTDNVHPNSSTTIVSGLPSPIIKEPQTASATVDTPVQSEARSGSRVSATATTGSGIPASLGRYKDTMPLTPTALLPKFDLVFAEPTFREVGGRQQSRPLQLDNLQKLRGQQAPENATFSSWLLHAEECLRQVRILQGRNPTEEEAVALIVSRMEAGSAAAIWFASIDGGLTAPERTNYAAFRCAFLQRFVTVKDVRDVLDKLDHLKMGAAESMEAYYARTLALSGQLAAGTRSAADIQRNFILGLPSSMRDMFDLQWTLLAARGVEPSTSLSVVFEIARNVWTSLGDRQRGRDREFDRARVREDYRARTIRDRDHPRYRDEFVRDRRYVGREDSTRTPSNRQPHEQQPRQGHGTTGPR